MSRLVDKLKKISQDAPQPMGFRAAQSATPKPKMLLIASLTRAETGNAADYVAGADGGLVIISASSEAKALKEASEAAPDIPWGAWLKGSSQIEMEVFGAVTRCRVETAQSLQILGQVSRLLSHLAANALGWVFTGINTTGRYL